MSNPGLNPEDPVFTNVIRTPRENLDRLETFVRSKVADCLSHIRDQTDRSWVPGRSLEVSLPMITNCQPGVQGEILRFLTRVCEIKDWKAQVNPSGLVPTITITPRSLDARWEEFEPGKPKT